MSSADFCCRDLLYQVPGRHLVVVVVVVAVAVVVVVVAALEP